MGGGCLLTPHFVILDGSTSSGCGSWGSGSGFHDVVSLLGQGLDELRMLEEVGDALNEHPAQFLGCSLCQTHAIEQVVLVGEGKFPVSRELEVHLSVVLGDLDAAVGLALDEEQWQLQLLAGVGCGAIDVQVTLRVVQERVGDLDVPLLELGDGDLLLDEL